MNPLQSIENLICRLPNENNAPVDLLRVHDKTANTTLGIYLKGRVVDHVVQGSCGWGHLIEGDQICAVNGVSVDGYSVLKEIQSARDAVGIAVTFTVDRQGREQDIVLLRQRVESVQRAESIIQLLMEHGELIQFMGGLESQDGRVSQLRQRLQNSFEAIQMQFGEMQHEICQTEHNLATHLSYLQDQTERKLKQARAMFEDIVTSDDASQGRMAELVQNAIADRKKMESLTKELKDCQLELQASQRNVRELEHAMQQGKNSAKDKDLAIRELEQMQISAFATMEKKNQEESQRVNQMVADLEKELRQSLKANSDLQCDQTNMTQRCRELETENAALSNNLRVCQSQLHQREGRGMTEPDVFKNVQERCRMLEKQLEESQKAQAQLSDSHALQKQDLVQRMENLVASNQNLRQAMEAGERLLLELKSARTALQAELLKARQDLKASSQKCRSLEMDLARRAQTFEAATQKCWSLEEQLNKAIEDGAATKEQLKISEQATQTAAKQVESMQQSRNNLTQKVEALQSGLAHAQGQVYLEVQEKEQATRRVQVLETELEGLKQQTHRLKATMTKERQAWDESVASKTQVLDKEVRDLEVSMTKVRMVLEESLVSKKKEVQELKVTMAKERQELEQALANKTNAVQLLEATIAKERKELERMLTNKKEDEELETTMTTALADKTKEVQELEVGRANERQAMELLLSEKTKEVQELQVTLAQERQAFELSLSEKTKEVQEVEVVLAQVRQALEQSHEETKAMEESLAVNTKEYDMVLAEKTKEYEKEVHEHASKLTRERDEWAVREIEFSKCRVQLSEAKTMQQMAEMEVDGLRAMMENLKLQGLTEERKEALEAELQDLQEQQRLLQAKYDERAEVEMQLTALSQALELELKDCRQALSDSEIARLSAEGQASENEKMASDCQARLDKEGNEMEAIMAEVGNLQKAVVEQNSLYVLAQAQLASAQAHIERLEALHPRLEAASSLFMPDADVKKASRWLGIDDSVTLEETGEPPTVVAKFNVRAIASSILTNGAAAVYRKMKSPITSPGISRSTSSK